MNRKLELPQTKTDEKPIKRKRDEHSIRRHEKTNECLSNKVHLHYYKTLDPGDSLQIDLKLIFSTDIKITIDVAELKFHLKNEFYGYMNKLKSQ